MSKARIQHTSQDTRQSIALGRGGGIFTGKWGEKPSDAWWETDLQEYGAKKAREAQYDAVDNKYLGVTPGAGGATAGTGGDWNQSNGAFSFDDAAQKMMQQAKDMSALQLENSKQMMGLSSGYRAAESAQNYNQQMGLDNNTGRLKSAESAQNYNQQLGLDNNTSRNSVNEYSSRTTNDMRRDGQQQTFQMKLQESNQGFQKSMQGNQFNQERTMFDKNTAAQTETINSARNAASNLFSKGNPFSTMR